MAGTDLDLRTTLQHVVDTATALTGARHGALALFHGEDRRVTDLFTAGMSDAERRAVAPLLHGRTGLLGALVDDERAVRVDDLTAPPHSREVPAPLTVRSFLGAPVLAHTEVLGGLCLTAEEPGRFTDTERTLLRLLASQASAAIGGARLHEAARQRDHWIEGAAAVTRALLTGAGTTDALTTVAERARVLAGAAAGVILLPTPDGGMEIVAASTLDDPAGIVGTAIEPGSPVLVQLLGGEEVFIEDSATDERMTTAVRSRYGPSMMLPLQSGATSSARSPFPADAAAPRTRRWTGSSPPSSPPRPRSPW